MSASSNTHVLKAPRSPEEALHAWVDERANECIPVDRCTVSDPRVCTGRRDIYGMCTLCWRRLERLRRG